eukprot:GGOE01019356.1.p1 GENE.GGOE01019356.1~~GGOE01019356.1.p1  ORF type:complete len:703 (-),score=217.84 GGOE01019356.1:219-2273(-)
MEEPEEKALDPAVLRCTLDLLPLSPCTVAALRKSFFFSHATSIQQKAIPIALQANTNVVVEACTGSGKTLAFLLPLVESMLRHNEERIKQTGRPVLTKSIQAVVLSPSKNLSRQTFRVLQRLLAPLPHNIRCFLWGDAPMRRDVEAFQRCNRGGGNVLLSHPECLRQRLAEAQGSGISIPFDQDLFCLIIDEADVILQTKGQMVAALLDRLPACRTIGLYGATSTSCPQTFSFIQSHMGEVVHLQDDDVRWDDLPADLDLANDEIPTPKLLISAELLQSVCTPDGQRHCVMIRDKSSTQLNLSNRFMWVAAEERMSLLVHLLKLHSTKKHFVFFNSAESLEYVAQLLDHLGDGGAGVLVGFTMYRVHAELKEQQRLARFHRFIQDERGIMLCTDTSIAFGIDIRNVDYVLHYDMPGDPRVYLHRVGRTARMGMTGTSIAFLPSEQRAELTAPGGYLERLNGSLSLVELKAPGGPSVFNMMPLVRRLLLSHPELQDRAEAAVLRYAADVLEGEGMPPRRETDGRGEEHVRWFMESLGLEVTRRSHLPTYMEKARAVLSTPLSSSTTDNSHPPPQPTDTEVKAVAQELLLPVDRDKQSGTPEDGDAVGGLVQCDASEGLQHAPHRGDAGPEVTEGTTPRRKGKKRQRQAAGGSPAPACPPIAGDTSQGATPKHTKSGRSGKQSAST